MTAATPTIDQKTDAAVEKARVLLDALMPLAIDRPGALYSVTEAVDLLGLPHRTILKAVNDGTIPHTRLGPSTIRISGHAIVESDLYRRDDK